MDILTTRLFSQTDCDRLIEQTEATYPSRKKQNDKWRDWLKQGDNEERLLKNNPDLDINAAYISDCGSDMLFCDEE